MEDGLCEEEIGKMKLLDKTRTKNTDGAMRHGSSWMELIQQEHHASANNYY